MPYASQSQARKFHADPKLRHLAKEYDAATPNIRGLPQRVKKPKLKRKKKSNG
jgi:hypothetical protein